MWHIQDTVVTGRGHLLRQQPGQDRTFSLTRNGVTAAALSDGAGSAPLSHEGAEQAVRAACEVLCGQFETFSGPATPFEMRRAVLEAVQAAIRRRAQELNTHPSALACTLLAVAVQGDRYLVFHVGDGVIGYQKEGVVRVVSRPQNGEFANTTTFVTARDALVKSRVLRGRQPGLEGFVLLSDGCEAALYHKGKEKLAPLVGRLFQRAELLSQEVSRQWLRAVIEGPVAHRTQDDCSLLLLSRQTKSFGHWARLPQREQAAVLGIITQNRNRRRRMIRRYRALYGAEET